MSAVIQAFREVLITLNGARRQGCTTAAINAVKECNGALVVGNRNHASEISDKEGIKCYSLFEIEMGRMRGKTGAIIFDSDAVMTLLSIAIAEVEKRAGEKACYEEALLGLVNIESFEEYLLRRIDAKKVLKGQ